ncbi:hypothetical protein D3C87_1727620 [compost metagenome]
MAVACVDFADVHVLLAAALELLPREAVQMLADARRAVLAERGRQRLDVPLHPAFGDLIKALLNEL